MLNRWILAAGAALTLAVTTPDLAHAQRGGGPGRGGGGGRGGFGGPGRGGFGGPGGSGFRVGVGPGGIGVGYRSGNFAIGVGSGPGRGGFYCPGYRGGFYGPGYGLYGGRPPIVVSSYYRPPVVVSSNYYDPTPTVVSPTIVTPATESAAVLVDVRVPVADAAVWFDGQPTSQTGDVRSFQSPSLEQGRTYTYTIRARWLEGGQPIDMTRQVRVTAGQRVTVDFTRPEA